MLDLGQILFFSLEFTLFGKNIIQNKFCDFVEFEYTQHFLFQDERFTVQRQNMILQCLKILHPDLECSPFWPYDFE